MPWDDFGGFRLADGPGRRSFARRELVSAAFSKVQRCLTMLKSGGSHQVFALSPLAGTPRYIRTRGAAMSLQFDPETAVSDLARADRRLARVIRLAGPFTHRPEKMQSPFEALLRAIV